MTDKKNKTVYLNVRLTEEDYKTFQAICHNEGTTVSELIRQYVSEVIEISS